jgi:transglutaminase-like putative cysteine protease
MPILTVRHVTTYRYRQPVGFGEHRILFRPRDSHDQRLIEARMDVTPRPAEVRWVHDVFGNSIALARFDSRATELRFDCYIQVDHRPDDTLHYELADHARIVPFSYGAEEMPDLLAAMVRQRPDPWHEVDQWARQFLRRDGPTGTLDLLAQMTERVHRDFVYVTRRERGVQEPAQTLHLGSGSCRDLALLMMEALRSLGFATRFVSGYLDTHTSSRRGGGATHAWVMVYLPGSGWVEYDPTNGIIGNRDLIRVAVARDPSQVVPVSGTWTGFPGDDLEMQVDVIVTSVDPEQMIAAVE